MQFGAMDLCGVRGQGVEGSKPLWCMPLNTQVFIDPHWFSQKYIKNTMLTPSGFTTNRVLVYGPGFEFAEKNDYLLYIYI